MDSKELKAIKDKIKIVSANEKKNIQCIEQISKDGDCFGMSYDEEQCRECVIAAELDGAKVKLNELCKKIYEELKGEKMSEKKKKPAEAENETSTPPQTESDTDTSPTEESMSIDYGKFFTSLMNKVNEAEPNFTKSKPGGKSWWKFGIGKKGYSLCAAFIRGKKFRIECYIDLGNDVENAKALTELEAKNEMIIPQLFADMPDSKLTFENIKDKRACRVFITNSNEIGEEKLLDWGTKLLLRFKQAFSQAK